MFHIHEIVKDDSKISTELVLILRHGITNWPLKLRNGLMDARFIIPARRTKQSKAL